MDTAFFYASKIGWALITPGTLLLILLFIGTLLVYFNFRRWAKKILTFTLLLFALIAFFPLGKWLAYPLESRFEANPALPAQLDGIIVLGGALSGERSETWRQVQLNSSADRYFHFVRIARHYPEAQLVFTGGSGGLTTQDFREADYAEELLFDLGLDTATIIFERDSRNTHENAVNSKVLAQPQPGQRWVLVTSATHMPRAVGVFCQQGWPVIPYPVDFETTPGTHLQPRLAFAENLDLLTKTIREYVGLVVYFSSGRSSRLLPTTCN